MSVVDKILGVLHVLKDPFTEAPFCFSCPPQVLVQEAKIAIHLALGYPLGFAEAKIAAVVRQALCSVIPNTYVLELSFEFKCSAHRVQKDLKTHPQIKNIIAIASGKGGVGKSTVCANIAAALVEAGARVGILDADIYGPSQPTMMGSTAPLEVNAAKQFIPRRVHGLQMVSMGLLVAKETPMIWRGPMATQALQQLLQQSAWESLDYLLIDLPPGTGDIQLTLCQKIPLAGVVVVTTPQEVACVDVLKSIEMFKKVSVSVLGLLENMAHHHCGSCGAKDFVFGEGGGAVLAEQASLAFLGSIPLHRSIALQADLGTPVVLSDPTSPLAEGYLSCATKIAALLAMRPRNFAHAFSNIVLKEKET